MCKRVQKTSQIKTRLFHFTSRNAMNIGKLGPFIIEWLFEKIPLFYFSGKFLKFGKLSSFCYNLPSINFYSKRKVL